MLAREPQRKGGREGEGRGDRGGFAYMHVVAFWPAAIAATTHGVNFPVVVRAQGSDRKEDMNVGCLGCRADAFGSGR